MSTTKKTKPKPPAIEVVQTEIPATKIVKTIKITVGGKTHEMTLEEANALAESIIAATGWKPKEGKNPLREYVEMIERDRKRRTQEEPWPNLPMPPYRPFRPYYGPTCEDGGVVWK